MVAFTLARMTVAMILMFMLTIIMTTGTFSVKAPWHSWVVIFPIAMMTVAMIFNFYADNYENCYVPSQ